MEDAVEDYAGPQCSTWNTRRAIELHVPRGTLRAMANVQNAAGTARERDGFPLPGRERWCDSCPEQAQSACLHHQCRGCWQHRGALIDCAHPHRIEAADRESLCPSGVHGGWQAEGADYFLKESSLFALGFGESDARLERQIAMGMPGMPVPEPKSSAVAPAG